MIGPIQLDSRLPWSKQILATCCLGLVAAFILGLVGLRLTIVASSKVTVASATVAPTTLEASSLVVSTHLDSLLVLLGLVALV